MTFLQPWLLFCLPLVAVPLVIHLINQQRFQSVQWAAMMFLLAAKTLNRGYTRLRQWLILLLRMVAVAAAILAISRPLSQGWLAVVGGDRSEAAIVLLDRSPSMSQGAAAGGETKLATARRQVAAALETLGTSRVVLIDSVSLAPIEIDSPQGLERMPETEPAAAAADLPRMLQAALAELTTAKSAASTIWICSDQRVNDWQVADGAWPALREKLAGLPQSVRLTLLGYAEPAADNLAVRVTRAELEPQEKAWQLVLDIAVRRQADTGPTRVPIQIELGPTRSTVDVELTGTETVLPRHVIAIDAASLAATAGGGGGGVKPRQASGFGRVSIPADTNPADNDFYFAFGTPPVRRTLVVAEDALTQRTLELIAGIAPDRLLKAAAEIVTADAVAALPLDDVALIIWQAALPEGDTPVVLNGFLDRGGQVIFLPPENPTAAAFDGLAWQAWVEHSPPLRPNSWRADEGLLAATLTGEALPVGELAIRRSCGIGGAGTPLAVLPDGRPLLVRAARARGGVSFLATTPADRDSDLAANGVVLYALVQRAIDTGLAAVGAARQADAGPTALGGTPLEQSAWRQIAGPPAVSTEAGFHAGVYAAAGRLVAVNRPAAEDAAAVANDAQIDTLFQGLSFNRFQQQAGGLGSIIEEIWRLFLVSLLMALIAEGLLCLPSRLRPVAGQRPREAIA